MAALQVQRSLLLREAQLLLAAAQELERRIQAAKLAGGQGSGLVPHLANARELHSTLSRLEESLGQLKTLTRHWSKTA